MKIMGRTAGGLKKPFTRPERQWPHRSGSIRMWTGGTVKSRARALRCVPMLSPSGRADNLAVDTREGGELPHPDRGGGINRKPTSKSKAWTNPCDSAMTLERTRTIPLPPHAVALWAAGDRRLGLREFKIISTFVA